MTSFPPLHITVFARPRRVALHEIAEEKKKKEEGLMNSERRFGRFFFHLPGFFFSGSKHVRLPDLTDLSIPALTDLPDIKD